MGAIHLVVRNRDVIVSCDMEFCKLRWPEVRTMRIAVRGRTGEMSAIQLRCGSAAGNARRSPARCRGSVAGEQEVASTLLGSGLVCCDAAVDRFSRAASSNHRGPSTGSLCCSRGGRSVSGGLVVEVVPVRSGQPAGFFSLFRPQVLSVRRGDLGG